MTLVDFLYLSQKYVTICKKKNFSEFLQKKVKTQPIIDQNFRHYFPILY